MPRASSATSGFFFCGMIDDPVDHASASVDVPELRGRPEDDLLGDPREVHRDLGQHVGALGGEVARRRPVDGVVDGVDEPQVVGDRRRVEAQRGARQRPRPVGRVRQPRDRGPGTGRRRAAGPGRAPRGGGRAAPAARAAGACARAWRRPGTRAAWMSSASTTPATPRTTSRSSSRSHIRSWVAIWSLRERPARRRPPTSSPARSMSPRSRAVCTSSSSSAGRNAPDVDVVGEAAQPVEHGLELLVGEQPRAVQHPGVGPGAGDVVGREHPVELRRLRQRRHHRVRSGREPPAPEGRPFRHQPWSRCRRGDLRRQAPELHEALGQRLVEQVALVVGGEVEVVERLRAAAPGGHRAAAVQRHPDLAGHVLLGVESTKASRLRRSGENQRPS